MDFTFKAWSDVVQRQTALFEHVSSCLRQRSLRHFIIYKAIHGYIDIDVSDYVTFNNHLSTRHGQTAGYQADLATGRERQMDDDWRARGIAWILF